MFALFQSEFAGISVRRASESHGQTLLPAEHRPILPKIPSSQSLLPSLLAPLLFTILTIVLELVMPSLTFRRLAAAAAIAFVLAAPTAVSACPLCKLANESKQSDEEQNRRPQAYMYSILFMLSMPATLLTGFSLGFYRLWKNHQLIAGNQPMPGDDLIV